MGLMAVVVASQLEFLESVIFRFWFDSYGWHLNFDAIAGAVALPKEGGALLCWLRPSQ
jgi:hypothetical protein